LRALLGTQGGLTPALSDLVAASEAEPPTPSAPTVSLLQLLGEQGLSHDAFMLVRGATLELDLAPREGFARTGAYSSRVAFLDARDVQGQPLLSPTGLATAALTGAHPFLGPLALTESSIQPDQVLIRATVTSETGTPGASNTR
jgi:hypothetical protein